VRLVPKLKRWQWVLVAVVVVVVVLYASRASRRPASSSGMDSAGSRACTEFSDGYPAAKTKTTRLALADLVTRSSSHSAVKTVADRATEMGRRAAGTDAQWKKSADALLAACRAAGWR
jgi:hypothetical protein